MARTVLLDTGKGSYERLKVTKVALENVSIYEDPSADKPIVVGKAKVVNLAFEKTVFARVTFDDWATYRDYKASYLETCIDSDEHFDIFGFGFSRNDNSAKDVQFVLSCVQNGVQYWDNNGECNYQFHLSEVLSAEEAADLQAADWRASQQEEIILEECEYPQFQPHPLTPTKLRFYSSIRNAPEKDIVPAKVKDVKHMYIHESLALQTLWDEPSSEPAEELIASVSQQGECCGPPSGDNDEDEVQAISVGAEEYTPENAGEEVTTIEEDLVEPTRVAKREESESEQDIFTKLEKLCQSGNPEDLEKLGDHEKSQVKDKDGSARGTSIVEAEEGQASEKEGSATNEAGDQEKRDSETNSNLREGESSKEIIGNESTPTKKKKKGFFSKLCCGNAEYD